MFYKRIYGNYIQIFCSNMAIAVAILGESDIITSAVGIVSFTLRTAMGTTSTTVMALIKLLQYVE